MGPHTVLPKEKIPQEFVVPTIADYVACVKGGNKFALYVGYSACQYAGCTFNRAYDLNGKSILIRDDNQEFHDYFGKDTRDVRFLSEIDLRGSR